MLCAEEGCQNQDKQSPQVVEDEAQVVAGGAEQRIDGVAGVAEQVVSSEPAIGFHVADGGLEGASSPQFAPDCGGDAARRRSIDDPPQRRD